MKPTVNKFYFERFRGTWGIFQWTSITDNGIITSSHIQNELTYEDAVTTMYRLNGWGTPKNIKRQF